MASLLFVDPLNAVSAEILRDTEGDGHRVCHCSTVVAALAYAQTIPVDVVFLGMGGHDTNLVEDLDAVRQFSPRPEIIVMSAQGSPEEAAQAIHGGAWDYLDYPSSPRALGLVLSRILHFCSQRGLAPPQPRAWKDSTIIGNSAQMRACLEIAAQAAGSDAHVLITGETGTGKELFAAAIHANSARARGNFVVVDCAALPENLVDSTLMGHERGAFTGAERAHIGLITQADGGTLFLDEVGELPLATQKSFLRVLQERRFRPVGGRAEVTSNFRIIAASNRNLDELTNRGEFRKDLLFRIRAFTVDLPPLRERPGDIADLIRHHVPLLCERMGLANKDVSGDFYEIAQRYSWPGNVRELVNALERSIASAQNEQTIFATHLPNYIRIHIAQQAVRRQPDNVPPQESFPEILPPEFPSMAKARSRAIDEAERRYLADLYAFTEGDIDKACRISELSRSRLYALLKRHSLSFSRR
jgi:two-component system NtrC family response regulator